MGVFQRTSMPSDERVDNEDSGAYSDLDQLARQALAGLAADLGADRALLVEMGTGGPAVLLDSGYSTRREELAKPEDRPLYRWTGPRTPSPRDDTMLRLPLDTGTADRCFVAALFSSPERGCMPFVEKSVQRLMPVLAPGLLLWRKLRAERVRNKALQAAMHLSALGVVVLDAAAECIFTNRAAAAILDRADGLRRSGSSITATAMKDALRLKLAMAHTGAACNQSASPPSLVLKVARSVSPAPLVLTISCDRSDSSVDESMTVIHILDPEADVGSSIEAVCHLHGLSGMERALAMQLSAGRTVDEAAAELHLKPQTARSYLKQIFLKTDTGRQSDLIRFLYRNAVRIAAPTTAVTA